MHISIDTITTIGSDNGLAPGRCQAISLTNGGIMLIGPFGTNFSEILIETHTFSFKKMHLKMSEKMAAILSLRQCVKKGNTAAVWCHYNMASFLYTPHHRHPIPDP